MSRDFTPRDMYISEQYFLKEKGESLFDIINSMTMTYGDTSSPLRSSEEIALRTQYPLFGHFLNSFPDIHASLSKIAGGIDLLKKHESELREYIDTGKGDKDSYVIKWFEGELDKNFYYSEHNEELFVAHILDEAAEIARQSPSTTVTNEQIYTALADELEETIRAGHYGRWDDICVEIPIVDHYRPGYNRIVVWGEENDEEEHFYSVSVRKATPGDEVGEEIYKTFSDSSDFSALETAVYAALKDADSRTASIIQPVTEADKTKGNTAEHLLNIDIAKFRRCFDETYKFLYEHDDNVQYYGAAVEEFDRFLANYPEFVGEFTKHRGDFISSDREAAAFIFTLQDQITQKESLEKPSLLSQIESAEAKRLSSAPTGISPELKKGPAAER